MTVYYLQSSRIRSTNLSPSEWSYFLPFTDICFFIEPQIYTSAMEPIFSAPMYPSAGYQMRILMPDFLQRANASSLPDEWERGGCGRIVLEWLRACSL